MSTPAVKCAGKVYGSGFRPYGCSRTGKLEHDGKMWCSTHHPPSERARIAARQVAWKAQFDAERDMLQRQSDARAEQARRAECFDDLLAALRDLAEAVESMQATFGCIRGGTPEEDDMHIHEEWAEGFLKIRMEYASAAIAKATGGTP
jgi:hypothetical protein